MSKSKKRVIGDVVRIGLGDGFHTYARVLPDVLFAFYDARVDQDLPIDQIVALPVLFQVAARTHAIESGRWPVVGNAPVDDPLLNPPLFFMQDALRKDQFSVYEKGGTIRPATKEECVGLERAAVWEPNHVEDRLRDHYAGRKNKWVESLKMKG